MLTITTIATSLNESKLGLYLRFEVSEPDDALYIMLRSEAAFDHALDEQIGHLCSFSNAKTGGLKAWILFNASTRIETLTMGLYRFYDRKMQKLKKITIVE